MSGPDTYDTNSYTNCQNIFSNSNRTVNFISSAATGEQLSQTVEGKTTGKFYVEFNIDAVGSGGGGYASVGFVNSIGVTNSNFQFAGYWGGFNNGASCRYDSNGQIHFQSVTLPWGTGPTWTTGDVIGLAFDMVTPNFSLNKNGGSFITVTNAMQSGLGNSCRVYPAAGTVTINGTTTITINTGQMPFAYPIPAGFTGGWPNTTAGTYIGSLATNAIGPGGLITTPNTVVVSPFVAGYSGTITELVFAPNGAFYITGSAFPTVGVVYDATGAGGTPGNLLGSTNVSAGVAPGEITFTLGTPISITSGTTYYLGFLVGSQSGGTTNKFNNPWNGVSGSGGIGSYKVAVTYPTPPSTFGTGTGQNWSLPAIAYATPTPPPSVVGNSFGQII